MLLATQVGLMRVRRGLPSGSSSQVGQNVKRDQICKRCREVASSLYKGISSNSSTMIFSADGASSVAAQRSAVVGSAPQTAGECHDVEYATDNRHRTGIVHHAPDVGSLPETE